MSASARAAPSYRVAYGQTAARSATWPVEVPLGSEVSVAVAGGAVVGGRVRPGGPVVPPAAGPARSPPSGVTVGRTATAVITAAAPASASAGADHRDHRTRHGCPAVRSRIR